MITISAFADEIGPDLKLQMDVCEANGLRCIDIRGINDVNVSKFTLAAAADYRRQLDDRGFKVPCIGSPLGKIRVDEDFGAHLDLTRHCCEVARGLGTNFIRIFSFYPPTGGDILAHRQQVLDRMAAMVCIAQSVGCILLHENEKAIYGARPAQVADILTSLGTMNIRGIFDPANYVEEGFNPYDDGWKKGLDGMTHYLHIKDKKPGQDVCVPAGQGDGQFEQIFRDLAARNWSGTMTLEPHLAKAEQFKGHTGPDLFKVAVDSLKGLLNKCGLAIAT